MKEQSKAVITAAWITGILGCVGVIVAAIIALGASLIQRSAGQAEPTAIVVTATSFQSVTQPSETIQQVTQQPTAQVSSPPTSIPPTATQAPLVVTFEVFANLSWQNTNVQIASGDRLRIIWDGKSKWRGTDSGDFSDPLGGYIDTSNPQYACPPLMPPEEAGWNALVAKIGDNGVVTNPFKVIPTGEGKLQLAMNDCDSQRYDNEGSVIVTVEVSR